MILAHRIQLDPTVKQAKYFAQACGTARFVWNWALAEWSEQYKAGGKPKANELKRYFNSVKYEKYPWLETIHRDAHSQPFTNLNTTFQHFFKKIGKYPKFKKKGKCRDSFYVANDQCKILPGKINLPKVGFVKMREDLRFAGKVTSVTVSREVDRWFVSISVDVPEPEKPVPAPKGPSIGLDLGLTTFATLSIGEKVSAPKPLAAGIRRLQRLSRRVSRKQLGSSNRRKSSLRLARWHRRVKNIRLDFLHKLSTRLSKNHARICVESLNVSGMVRNRHLSRAISDAGWSEFIRQLDYKSKLYGSELIKRDQFFPSSKLCSNCGHRLKELSLAVRNWICPSCGAAHDRDANAAKNLNNINTEGYSGFQACGDCSADARLPSRETAVCEAGTTTGADSRLLTP